ncbi:MAG TPA: hypothetical protein VF212_12825 [Longimicrobiales bacterium]
MKTPFASKGISQPVRRRVDLAIAVAQERLLGTHVEHALELIELVGDQVPFDDALDIYTRLLRLSDDETRIITTRALAILGEDGTHRKTWPERMAEADAAAELGRARFGLFGNLRQRLRGRINEKLRRWIELEAARTEVALLGAHVDNALHFVEILDEELPFTEAVELYLEALDVREGIGEVVYYFTLTRLNERLIPDRHARAVGSDAAAANSAASRPLRMMDG